MRRNFGLPQHQAVSGDAKGGCRAELTRDARPSPTRSRTSARTCGEVGDPDSPCQTARHQANLMSNLITFSGLDGAGKTTQISLFLEHLERESTSFSKLEMYDDISVAALVRRKLASKPPTAAAGSASAQPAADTSNGPRDPEPLRLDKNRSDLPTVVARQFVYLLDLQRFLIVRRRHATEPDGVLVMDRYFFDSLANLLTASDLAAPYVSLFLKLAPTPRLAVLLDVAPETAFRRKREYPLEYLRQRRSAYHKIFARVETAFVLDGEQEPEMVHQRLIERAGSVLHKQELSSHV